MIALYIAGLLLLAAIAVVIYCYRTCFYAQRNRKEDPYALLEGEQYQVLSEGIFYCTRRMEETPCEFVETTSREGLKLSARYYHNWDGAPVLILLHGYRSMALRDCAGGFLLGKKASFNVLVADHRAHGRSEGNVITFGIQERWDCLQWVRYIRDRFGADTPVLLSGLSMGAATVLMASELPLPDNVAGILADCPYSSPAGIMRKVARDRKLPDGLAYPFIRIAASLLGGFNLEETTAANAVKQAKVPILLFHGEDDRFVPCDMSREIAKNCKSRCELHTVPNAGHGLCYTMDPDRYEEFTFRFLWSLPTIAPHLEESATAAKYREGTL